MKINLLIFSIIKKELAIILATPALYIFSIAFLIILGILTFYTGDFFGRNQADLKIFFYFHPWLYCFLMPALTMNSWAEEYKTNTIEILITLPIKTKTLVLAKFLTNWLLLLLILCLSFPIWITVNILGDPDNLLIFANYLTSLLLGGMMLAIGCFASALSKNQIIGLIIAVSINFLLLVIGFDNFIKFIDTILPIYLANSIYSMSIWLNFTNMINGIVSLANLIYFCLLTIIFLFATDLILNFKISKQ